MENRPNFVTDEHLEFLDDLRELGVVNMWGAAALYIREEFIGLSKEQCTELLLYWIHSFNERHSEEIKEN